MSQITDPSPFIFFVLEQGYITSEQAVDSCLALGESYANEHPFDIKDFWRQKSWLAPVKTDELHRLFLHEQDTSPQPKVDESVQLLKTIEQTITVTETGVVPVRSLGGGTTADLFSASSGSMPELDAALMRDATSSIPELDSAKSVKIPRKSLDTDARTGLALKRPSKDEWSPARTYQERYRISGELGRGGLGVVFEAYDLDLGRKVAKKSLLKGSEATEAESHLLINEARLTGQLEHPNIMPVYEIGKTPDNELYYTMRLLPPNNLEQAIQKNELSLLQYIKIVQQVCMGLEYAHSRGVVHRDIKPANIIQGLFGEVLILDWGIAKITQPELEQSMCPTTPAMSTQSIKGTPIYMSPESIKLGQVSTKLDQYSLGVILYEILTGRHPHYDDNLYTLLFKICSEEVIPPSERAPDKVIPQELEQICMKMLDKDPDERFASCREVHDRLEEFLEGSKEKERRRLAAKKRIQDAFETIAEYKLTKKRAEELQAEWEVANRELKLWESLEKKRPVWEKEKLYQFTRQHAISLFGEAIQKYEQALEHEPGNPEARKGLADLYWDRFLEAELEHDELQQIYYRDLVRFYDDGSYALLLEGNSSLELVTEPSGALVSVYGYEEHDCKLRERPIKEELTTPVQVELPMGSYLLKIRKDGYREARYPVHLRRCEEVRAEVRLHEQGTAPGGYAYVPKGAFPFGGDSKALVSVPRQELVLDDFFISRFPVTFGEYLDFLSDVHAEDPEKAKSMIPRSREEEFAILDAAGRYIPNRGALWHGPIAKRYPEGRGLEARLPVFGVTWYEAVLYCRWRSKKEGRLVVLPSEQQWEKAAAGVDGRIYPWGNKFEATYCKMSRSRRPEELQPEPIGTFLEDASPYTVHDVVGSISEWTLSMSIPELQALDGEPSITAVQRGGGWLASNPQALRIGTRVLRDGKHRSYNCGFRVVTFASDYIS